MKNFTVKIKQRGVAPYRFCVPAQNSVEALRIGLKTMQSVGSVVVTAK